MLVFAFAIFYLVCMIMQLNSNQVTVRQFLSFSCVVLAFMAGLRNIDIWPDTSVYAYGFQISNTLFRFSLSDTPYGYKEEGFYFLSVLVRTFTSNAHVFLLFISAITFLFIYKSLRSLSIYPLIGLCVYIARFMIGRNFIQIRSGLAYAIVIYAIPLIQRKDWKRYFLLVLIAYTMHHSAIIAVPIYFICNWLKPKNMYVYFGLIVAFAIGIFGQGVVHGFIEDNASDLDIVRYTERGGEENYFEGTGLSNPMIYFQTVLLLVYTKLEKKLAPIDKYYYVIRWCYLYATIILISFCTYKVLAGRTSTLFATLEIAIIPALAQLMGRRNKALSFTFIGVLLTTIFFLYQNQ